MDELLRSSASRKRLSSLVCDEDRVISIAHMNEFACKGLTTRAPEFLILKQKSPAANCRRACFEASLKLGMISYRSKVRQKLRIKTHHIYISIC